MEQFYLGLWSEYGNHAHQANVVSSCGWLHIIGLDCWSTFLMGSSDYPHPSQWPHCEQEEDIIHHVLATCVFARQCLLQWAGLQTLSPQPGETSSNKVLGVSNIQYQSSRPQSLGKAETLWLNLSIWFGFHRFSASALTNFLVLRFCIY